MNIVSKNNAFSTTRLLSDCMLPVSSGAGEDPCISKFTRFEGGLRTKGEFKQHFIKEGDDWYVCDKFGRKIDAVIIPSNIPYMKLPLVTVVTVVYNGIRFIEETIQSVLRQNYPNIEYIIVDGGSTDGTLDVIKKYEQVIDYWMSEPDAGIYDAMNKGVALSSGRWLNMLNVGDTFNGTDVFSECKFDDDNVVIYFSDTILLKNDNYSIERADFKKRRFVHQSFIYDKELHRRYGSYSSLPKMTISDYLFFSPIWKPTNSIKLNNPISVFRCGGISSGDSHVYQRMAVDILCGNVSAFVGALKIVVFPWYRFLFVNFIKPIRSFWAK